MPEELHARDSFAQQSTPLECAQCGRTLARETRFCPYCITERSAPNAVISRTDKVVHANFGGRNHTLVKELIARQSILPSLATPPTPSVTERKVPSDGSSLPKVVSSTAEPSSSLVRKSPLSSRRLWLLGVPGVAVVLLIRAMLPTEQHGAPVRAADTMVYVVRDDATVRDAPTTINSIKLGTLLRATVISGEWQARNAAGYRWFKITTGSFAGDYVWERSLSPTVPPNLIFQINLDETAVSNVDGHATPQTA